MIRKRKNTLQINDSFKSIEKFIEMEKQLTQSKLACISNQMNCVNSAIADVQNRFNDYYSSVQQNSEELISTTDNAENTKDDEIQNHDQDQGTKQELRHQHAKIDNDSLLLNPIAKVNTHEQITKNSHEIDQIIHSLTKFIEHIDKIIDSNLVRPSVQEKLNVTVNRLSDCINDLESAENIGK